MILIVDDLEVIQKAFDLNRVKVAGLVVNVAGDSKAGQGIFKYLGLTLGGAHKDGHVPILDPCFGQLFYLACHIHGLEGDVIRIFLKVFCISWGFFAFFRFVHQQVLALAFFNDGQLYVVGIRIKIPATFQLVVFVFIVYFTVFGGHDIFEDKVTKVQNFPSAPEIFGQVYLLGDG